MEERDGSEKAFVADAVNIGMEVVQQQHVSRQSMAGTSRLRDGAEGSFSSHTAASRWGMNDPDAPRWNKSTAQCSKPIVGFDFSAVSPSFERTFRHRLENRLAEVISDSSNDRNYRVVWFRIEILPTHVAWRPASPSSKGSNPPETHQSGSEQFE
jgi:hypothetical protein